MDERKNYIDVVKGIGIVFVVLGHIEGYEIFAGWKQFVASFHMPLFFVVSGILFKDAYVTRTDLSEFLKYRGLRLLVPYFVWGLIYMEDISIEYILRLGWGNNKLYGAAGLWFLPTMLVGLCVCYVLVKLYKNNVYISLITVVVILVISFVLDTIGDNTIVGKVGYPFSFDIGLLAGIFIFGGWMLNNIWKQQTSNIVKNVILCTGLLVVTWFVSRMNYRFINDVSFDRVVMARGSYGLFPLFILGALSGTIGVVLLGKIIGKSRPLEYIGRNSLIFMVTNHVAIKIISEAISFLKIKTDNLGFVTIIVYLCGALIICSFISFLVTKFIPILGGAKNVC